MNNYLFLTKNAIKTRLETDSDFRHEAMVVLLDRQTSEEQETKTTKNKNARGFMSSHAVRGTAVAMKIRNGEELTEEDEATVLKIAPRYSKQLASHFREQALAENPELAAQAAAFFTPQG